MINIDQIILTQLTKQKKVTPVKAVNPSTYIMKAIHNAFNNEGSGPIGYSTRKKQESQYPIAIRKKRQEQIAQGIQPEQEYVWDTSKTRGLKNYLNLAIKDLTDALQSKLPTIEVPGHGNYKFTSIRDDLGKNLRIEYTSELSSKNKAEIKLANPFKFQNIDGETYAIPQNAADYQLGLCVVYNMAKQNCSLEQALQLAEATPSRARTFNVMKPYFEKQFKNWWQKHTQLSIAGVLRMSKTNSSPVKPWTGGNNIPKTDITDKNGSPEHRYSVKMLDSGGAQLASGGRQQSISILRAAIAYNQKYNKAQLENTLQSIIDKIDKGFTKIPIHITKSLSDHKKDIVNQYILYRRGDDGKYIKSGSLDFLPILSQEVIESEYNRFNSKERKKTGKTPKSIQQFLTAYLNYEAGQLLSPVFGDVARGQKQFTFVKLPTQMSVDLKQASEFVVKYLQELSTQGQSLAQLFNISKAQSSITKELSQYLSKNSTIKQYCVYEAASGAAKFSGQYINKPEQLESQAIASYILQISSGNVSIQYIPQWSKKHSNDVTINASFKTTTSKDFSVFSALRFASMNKVQNQSLEMIKEEQYSDCTYDLYYRTNKLTTEYRQSMKSIISQTNKKIDNIQKQLQLLNESDQMSKIKSLISSGFEIIKTTWQGIISTIKSYYTKLIKQILTVLKNTVNKGLQIFAKLVGLELDQSNTELIFNI